MNEMMIEQSTIESAAFTELQKWSIDPRFSTETIDRIVEELHERQNAYDADAWN